MEIDKETKETGEAPENGPLVAPKPTGPAVVGRLNDNDQGPLNIGVGRYQGHVMISFGRMVKAVALLPEEARDLAEHIKKQAGILDQQQAAPKKHRKKAKLG